MCSRGVESGDEHPSAAAAPSSAAPQQVTVGGSPLATAGARIGATLLDGLLILVTLGIGWIIWSVVLWKDATSPAKKMLRMRIVDANTGAPATMQQMVIREVVGKWVVGSVSSGLATFASLVMLFATPKRQVVWDYIGTTVVVRD